jgi:bifunctional polynucleotide phosphatase/kinase
MADSSLREGKSIVIDNTNPSKKVRYDYINLCKKHSIKHIRCFKMTTLIELCHHLNYVRQNLTKGEIRRIPDVGYNMFKNQYEEPDLSEGFTEILSVDFVPTFENEEHEHVFKQWTD